MANAGDLFGQDVSAEGRLARLWRAALDVVYPRHCLTCGVWIEHSRCGHVCAGCAATVKWVGPERCLKCGMPLGPFAEPKNQCPFCEGADLRFQRAGAPCRYEGTVRELIHAFKYRGATFLAAGFAELMVRDVTAAKTSEGVDLAMAVPLHWRKRLQRGYNQAELLAARIAGRLKVPLLRGRLVRVKDTPTQTALTRAQRQENLRGAFAVRRPEKVKGKTILLCDDVMTTGATASECARVLRAAGARAVYVSVAAR